MKSLADRLKFALTGPPKIRQVEIARACGISQPAVNDWISGKTKTIEGGNLLAAAKTLNVRPEWLAKGIGPMRPSGQVEQGPEIRGRVPLISWVQAGDFCEAVDTLQPGDAESWHPCPRDHSPSTYALRVTGESMAPRFIPGDLIMVDPEVTPDSGRFVIAKKTGSQEVTFKQLLQEGGHVYLKAINPQWPEPIIRLDEDWSICGVVICKVEIF